MGFIDNFFNSMMNQMGTTMKRVERNAKSPEDIDKARELRENYENLKRMQAERAHSKWENSQNDVPEDNTDSSGNQDTPSNEPNYDREDDRIVNYSSVDDQEVEHVSYIPIANINYHKRENGFIFFSCVKCGEKMKIKMQHEGRRMFNCPTCFREYVVKGEKIFSTE